MILAPSVALRGWCGGLRKLTASQRRVLTVASKPSDNGADGNGFTVLRALERGEMPGRGKRQCHRLRNEGLIPGIIHGLGMDDRREDINIAVNSKDIRRECRLLGSSFMCTPYYLVLEGGGDFCGRKEIVLANLVHTHPIKYDNVLTVNWVRWRGKNHIVSIPLVVTNEELSPVLRRGAYIQKYEQYLDVRVTSGNLSELPSVLEVDADSVMVGETLGINRIIFPSGIEVATPDRPFKSGNIMGRVIGKKSLNALVL